ncbi:hypothetical protein BpHYR1_023482 [Brachionus plicatilis]|uniref:Uncharacterized protein n=1 Tax=Brachionus plicatilis TaxID=10195 RepID=A0A3M7SEA3_BRAPC|nr:hypothetical protein BpHYR1_023482 [Brachionus plicatilis]
MRKISNNIKFYNMFRNNKRLSYLRLGQKKPKSSRYHESRFKLKEKFFCENELGCMREKPGLKNLSKDNVIPSSSVRVNFRLTSDGLLFETDKLSDLTDGDVYKKVIQSDSDSKRKYHGISMFKKSNVSLWPVILTINELPLSKRYCSENVAIAELFKSHKSFEIT